MDRSHHWLDESLSLCLDQNCDDLPTPTARMIINLTGAIRSLEKQLNLQDERLKIMYARLQLLEPKLANEYLRPDVVSLSDDGVLIRDEVA
jgi:hypothetical protein